MIRFETLDFILNYLCPHRITLLNLGNQDTIDPITGGIMRVCPDGRRMIIFRKEHR